MDTAVEITFEQVRGELEELVAEVGPEYRDQRYMDSRVYVHPAADGRPMEAGCMMGRWLHRFHNVSLEWLHEHEGSSIGTLIDHLSERDVLLPVQPKAVKYLSICQDKQDADYPWGEVLVRANTYAENYLEMEETV